MPRKYTPDPRGKRYKKYDENIIQEAVEEYRTSKMSLKAVADKYNIDKSVLYRHSTRTLKKQGGQTVLSEETEKLIIKYINICADWGYPLDSLDLRYIIKYYLDKLGRTELRFKNNFPGPDFASSFIKRHKNEISQRNCQNIKKHRAAVSPETIQNYFNELQESLNNVEPCNILNYDETNLTDDPGRKKILTKRGTKYPERVMNHSKASVSIMMSATADGNLLPPYVVYKAQNLYDTWREHGPPGARFNRSQSGWFDAVLFEDWIKTIVLPHFKGKEGKKVLIGDNLSSHLSLDAIKLCYEHDISFVFLPTNSTHLTQPLDVAFFRPMKVAWRNLLVKWKKTDGKTQGSVPKGCFPRLLKKLMEVLSENSEANILAGFKKSGIRPIDQNQVLGRLPKEVRDDDDKDAVDKSVLDILKEMRYGTMNLVEPKRKRKLDVIPGRSVGISNSENIEEEITPVIKKKNISACGNTKEYNKKEKPEKNIGKGKGKGKKTKTQDEKKTTDEKDNIERGKSEGKKAKVQEDVKSAEEENTNIIIDSTDVNKPDQFFYEELDTMPIIFEDVLFSGEEVVINNEIYQEETEVISSEEIQKKDTRKIEIISNEKLPDVMPVVTLNKCKKIHPNASLKLIKPDNNLFQSQPSTSGLNNIARRRTSYYKNDDEILKDLMDDNIE